MKNEIKKYSELNHKQIEEKPITKRVNLFDFVKEYKDHCMPLNFIWYSLLDKYNKKQYFEITIYDKSGKITLSDLKMKVKSEITPMVYGKADNSGEDRPYYNVISTTKIFNKMRLDLEELLGKGWDI